MAPNDDSKQLLSDVLDVNLYSRQIYALGQTSMFRLRSANVLISGMGSVGVEVAKNLVLGGVRHVTIQDTKVATWNDLSAQYYLDEKDIGKNRAESCFSKIEELNDSVTCSLSTEPLTYDFIQNFNVVVMTDCRFDEQVKINKWARESSTLFISADTAGLFGYVFADLGDTFRIDDIDGEPPKEVWLEHINTENGDVSTLDGALHGLEDGNFVQFEEVRGCAELNSHEPIKVTVKSKSVFNIGDAAAKFEKYTEGGRAKQVKVPFEVKYKSLEEALNDPTFLEWDFLKFDSPARLHQLFQALYKYEKENGNRPKPYSAEDANAFVKHLPAEPEIPEDFAKILSYTSSGNLQPVASIIGGITAQEIMKAITHHTTPLMGFLYVDNNEALPAKVRKELEKLDGSNFVPRNNRYDGQAAVFGWNFVEEVHKCSPFIVGAGAIGCELLKNYAMMGIGTADGSKIKITDMDQIEVSNLNRQFLFRKNDVGKKKSECAAAAVKGFNPKMNIVALADRVADDTEAVFNDDFFSDISCVTNALDNIDARRYMDRRCVYYHLPLLESGTMGTKGNTQVVYPHATESYSSSNDPPEKDIPICTLKNFPYEIQHTIQWAREMFEGLFTNPAETTNQFVTDERQFLERIESMNPTQKYQLLYTVKRALVDDRPKKPEDCITWARDLFQQYYHNQIAQLLHNFPAEQLTSEGVKFWSGTKRCPHVLNFDVNDPYHFDFVYAASILRAQQYRLQPIMDKKCIAEIASSFEVEPFQPKSDLRIAVTEEEAAAQDNMEEDAETQIEQLKLALARLNIRTTLDPIDFEKDDDTNHHMEFVTAASNLRAANYNINSADAMKTKQIAGRIIPALATTTAVVAGLVGLELYKIIDMRSFSKEVESERMKSGFINLALPLYAFSEPIGAPKKKYNDQEFTLWDRIEIDGPMKLQELIDKITEITGGLEVAMLSSGVSLLYAFFQSGKARERLNMDVVDAVEHISHTKIPDHRRSIVLEAACNNENGDDIEIPYIKYNI
uniref:Ubiquitin-activating enzyme E1 C-terminal domain-containing protein n=1 Tax=Panagrolaimus sp. PS1159 TaxID=55785 RepID=A0AC35FUY2_9BILA